MKPSGKPGPPPHYNSFIGLSTTFFLTHTATHKYTHISTAEKHGLPETNWTNFTILTLFCVRGTFGTMLLLDHLSNHVVVIVGIMWLHIHHVVITLTTHVTVKRSHRLSCTTDMILTRCHRSFPPHFLSPHIHTHIIPWVCCLLISLYCAVSTESSSKGSVFWWLEVLITDWHYLLFKDTPFCMQSRYLWLLSEIHSFTGL